MKNILLLAVLSVLCLGIIAAAPSYNFEHQKKFDCFDVKCPYETAMCKKTTKTSNDRNHLVTQVECSNEDGKVLETFEDQKPNPYDKSTTFSSFAFSANSRYHGTPNSLKKGTSF